MRDRYHQIVKEALVAEGWEITHDPYYLDIGDVDYQVDLGAERLLAASKGTEKIAIEVKSFLAESPTYEFHQAVGQYRNYLFALEEQEADRILYLAIPLFTYQTFFQRRMIQVSVRRNELRLIVYDPNQQEITQWIK